MNTVTLNILATADDQAKQQEEHRREQLLKDKQRNCKHAFIGKIGPMLKITELQCAHCGLSKSEAEKTCTPTLSNLVGTDLAGNPVSFDYELPASPRTVKTFGS